MEIEWQLPPDWKTIKLGLLAQEDAVQVRPSEHPKTLFNYWGLDAIEKGQFSEPQPNWVSGAEIAGACVRFDSRHILYSKLRPYLNKVITPSIEGIGATEWIVLRPDARMVDRHYLAYVLRSEPFVTYATDNSTGARMPRVRKDALWEAPIPLPYPDDPARSLETQRRIVARLDALLAEVAAARRLHAEIAEDTARVMEAVLREVFPDPFRKPPPGWTVKTVGEISKRPQYGYTQSAKSEPIGPKFLRITDIQNGQVDWTAVPHCEITERDLMRYRLQDRDIVFARSGATTGKTFLVRNPPEAVFASYLIRLQIIRHSTPDFVYWFFQSPYYWSQIAPRGGAQPNMNAQVLRQIAVPLPLDISVQNQIVNYLRSIQEEIIELCTIQEREKDLLDQVEQTILSHAFRGEL